MIGNPNDETRRQILQYFYDRNSMATSKFGKKGSARGLTSTGPWRPKNSLRAPSLRMNCASSPKEYR
jgi:hypothetical protein